MMKLLLLNTAIIVLLAVPGAKAQQVSLAQARQYYLNMDQDQCSGLKLAEQFESADKITDPLLRAYYGASAAAAPVCIDNPVKKLSWFKKGKDLLDQSVKSGISIFEIRFLRFATQSKSPHFLKYRDNIQEDKKFILSNLSKGEKEVNDSKSFAKIANFLINSNELNQKEKTMVKNYIAKNKAQSTLNSK